LIANRLTKPIAILVSALLVAIGFIALSAAPKSEAADAAQFDPGNIISDSVFYDFGTMSASDIQRFLNGKLPTCNDNDGGPKCIRDFVQDTPEITGESGRCDSLPAKQNQTAAQIIFAVANACKINPRVLLVTLQKEQGLIQATNPYQRMYDFALGMNCPDTADCSKSSAGFFYQLYKGAGQLQWYGDPRGSFTYLRVGSNITRRYQAANVESSKGINCGSKTFLLKSQATAALYYYTPYTPNAAALKNLYGTGDSCSAYGNRNFWRFYTDWFGSTIGGGFLLKSADSGTYFIIDNKKYLIDDADTVAALKPLGPLGTISQAYLDSFTDSGSMNRVIKSAAGVYYFVDGGQKYPFTNCAQAAQFLLDCNTAITLTTSQLNALATGNQMTEYVQGENGQTFFIQDGAKRQILDSESLVDSRLGVPALSQVKISAFKKLPWGKPIIRKGASFINEATKQLAVFDGTSYYDIDKATLADVDFTKWFIKSTGTMIGEALAPVASTVKIKSIVNAVDGTQYLITKDGKRKVTDAKQISKDAPVVSDDLLSLIPNAATEIESILFAKSSATKNVYLIFDGVKRPLLAAADAAKFTAGVKSTKTQTLSNSAFAQIPTGSPAIAPATYVRVGKVGYMIDGFNRALVIPDANQAALLGLASARSLTSAQLKAYSKTTKASGIKFVCGQNYFIAITGKFYAISTLDASHYPGRGLTLDATTCAVVAKSTATLGRFIKTADKKYYLVDGQTKRLIKDAAAYEKLRGSAAKAVLVGPYFLSKITTGKSAGSTMNLEAFDAGAPVVPVDPTPAPSASPKPSASSSPSPSASPKVSASPKASPTPTPTASALKPKTYTVVSGDYWNKIVAKLSVWGVTDAKLSAANPKITNKNNLQLGAILIVP
jgi:hypothetical protein